MSAETFTAPKRAIFSEIDKEAFLSSPVLSVLFVTGVRYMGDVGSVPVHPGAMRSADL